MKEDLSKKVLEKIKKEKVKPKPKWKFAIKDYAVWLGVVLAFLASSLSFAVILYMFINNDWDLYQRTSAGFFDFLFLMIPYVWLLFLAILIFLVYFNLRCTKKGYRFSLPMIIAGAFLLSIVLGSLFYNLGLGQKIDEVFAQKVPFYNTLLRHRVMMWQQPENGLLTGIVIEVEGKRDFRLRDVKEKIWKIMADPSLHNKTIELEPGVRVRVFGKKIKEGEFRAQIIRPLMGPGRHMMFSPGMILTPRVQIIMP